MTDNASNFTSLSHHAHHHSHTPSSLISSCCMRAKIGVMIIQSDLSFVYNTTVTLSPKYFHYDVPPSQWYFTSTPDTLSLSRTPRFPLFLILSTTQYIPLYTNSNPALDYRSHSHFPLLPGLVFLDAVTCNNTVQFLFLYPAIICACMLTSFTQSNSLIYHTYMLTAPPILC